MPTVDELASVFHDSTIFTKLDLLQGYLQIPLSEDSRDLTMFISHQGLYRFKRMPFGLSSAPSAFQKTMAATFSGLEGVEVFMDDIVVHGSTMEVHDRCLKGIRSRLCARADAPTQT